MVMLDIDMPTKCINCPLLGRDSMYCQVYPRKDLNLIEVTNSKPEWCPIIPEKEEKRIDPWIGTKPHAEDGFVANYCLPKGVWKKHFYSEEEYDVYQCSNCNRLIEIHKNDSIDNYNLCKCGAKMTVEKE